MELLLNVAWLALTAGAVAHVLRRRPEARVILTVACAAALLFPIISISDDLSGGHGPLEQTSAIPAVVIAFLVTIVALGRVVREPAAAVIVERIAMESDPRSPPRA